MNNIYNTTVQSPFRKSIRENYNRFLIEQSNHFPANECLKIDLHCHDHNSDTPDELWGRILKLPETWLKTKDLIKVLKSNHTNVITITNHNNARSCWELKDAGLDILSAAEFTCYFPDDELFVHILTYGFTPEQEVKLNQKRNNIYHFLVYTSEHNIPVILAHPLYFYSRSQRINMEYFEKFAVLFQRYEVMNGQRDYWQNLLTKEWVESLTPEKCEAYARKHNINPIDFGVDIHQPKVMTGGSDDHMGIFAGECGSFLHIPDLAQKLKTHSKSELALEAIRQGNIAPYGSIYENQKLNIALMDYFSQVATKMKDPGLFRILFHRGSASDKLACLTITNFILELQRHGKTETFFKFIHNALTGKKLNKLYTWQIAKDYKFSIKHLQSISESRRKSSKQFIKTTDKAIAELFTSLNLLIIKRINKFFNGKKPDFSISKLTTEEIARQFEVPSHLREMFYGKKTALADDMVNFNLGKIFDDLSFPILVSIVLAGSMVASTRLLCHNRNFLNEFSEYVDKHKHPKKALWLTDTFFDKNGVSNTLQLKLAEIQKHDLDIDFLICHPEAESEDHLHVVRPLTSFSFTSLGEQDFHIPDLLEIKNIFYQGGYDRIICSTEAPMGPIALLLKHTFNVPCYFYMHTDWLEFVKHTTQLSHSERDRIRRLLRFFYQQFDGIFALNSDHKNWLSNHEMQIDADKIYVTSHWIKELGKQKEKINLHKVYKELKLEENNTKPILFFAGRISKEKGIFDFPYIFKKVQKRIPDIQMVIAGSGPAEYTLRKQFPEAIYLGWVNKKQIKRYYQALDLFLFPSRFDTFGNVVLEAFARGMPVIAYNLKGPKDIIEHEKNGYLVEDKDDMAEKIIDYFSDNTDRQSFKDNAIKRAHSPAFQAETIMHDIQKNIGLIDG
jgi:glycosyltransferase involved in cell wall biosynthesis/predicted metal-dependent phosphoesterase TrpH